jgi:hypothetical protein
MAKRSKPAHPDGLGRGGRAGVLAARRPPAAEPVERDEARARLQALLREVDRDEAVLRVIIPPDAWRDLHPWRSVVARWPAAKRDAWGVRANELQNLGHEWDRAEIIAFEELHGGE